MSNVYTAGTKPAEGSFMKTSFFFKKQMVKMVLGVILFFLFYFLLLSLSVILSLGCIAAGIYIYLTYKAGLLISLPLILLGILTFTILIRFLFRRQKPVNPYRMEIFESDHPLLFAMIGELTTETNARFPEKIFLIPDVNAGVFYNSTVLSMFCPSGKKNLEIGLGLVNSLNISELKMTLAHEFGHFTQRSMTLGSYVYTLNKVVYNMLYENDHWNKKVIRWSGMGIFHGIFASASLYLTNGMQYMLRRMYILLNRQYMLLRREMEFHADAVALSVCGTDVALSTMRRSEMSIFCFENCLEQLPELAEEKLQFSNIYEAHSAMIRHYASRNDVPLDHEQLPVITDDYFSTFLRSQVQLRDQWASHPTREERERRYKSADIPSDNVKTVSAWRLFNHPEQLQQEMSARIYQLEVPDAEDYEPYPVENFIADLEVKQLLYALPEVYHGYYDNRPFPVIDLDKLQPLSVDEMQGLSFSNLYTPAVVLRLRHYFRNRQDAETLQAIADGDIQTRYFEFAGEQFPASQARKELKGLQQQINEDGEWLAHHDQLAFRYHYTVALSKGKELKEQYLELYIHEQFADKLGHVIVKIMNSISIIFGSSGISVKRAMPYFDLLRQGSDELRELLEKLSSIWLVADLWPPLLQAQVKHFLSYRYIYLQDNEPVEVEISNLHAIISAIPGHYNNSICLIKKALLEMLA